MVTGLIDLYFFQRREIFVYAVVTYGIEIVLLPGIRALGVDGDAAKL